MAIEELSNMYILVIIAVIIAVAVVSYFVPVFICSFAPLYNYYGGDNSKAWWLKCQKLR